jgi:hypothetical protein
MVNNFFDIIFDKSELSTTAKTSYNSLEYTVDHKSTIDNIIAGIKELDSEFKKGIDKIVNIFLYNLIYYYGYGTKLTKILLLNKKYTEFEFMNRINETRLDPKLLEERKARINDKRIKMEIAQEKRGIRYRDYMNEENLVQKYKNTASNRLHQLELEEKRLIEEEEEKRSKEEYGFESINSNQAEITKLLEYYNNIRKMIFWELFNNKSEKNELDRNQIIRNQIIRYKLGRNQIIRNELDRNQIIRNELDRNQIIRNELDRNQIIRNELEEKIKLLSLQTYNEIIDIKEIDDGLIFFINNIYMYLDEKLIKMYSNEEIIKMYSKLYSELIEVQLNLLHLLKSQNKYIIVIKEYIKGILTYVRNIIPYVKNIIQSRK